MPPHTPLTLSCKRREKERQEHGVRGTTVVVVAAAAVAPAALLFHSPPFAALVSPFLPSFSPPVLQLSSLLSCPCASNVQSSEQRREREKAMQAQSHAPGDPVDCTLPRNQLIPSSPCPLLTTTTTTTTREKDEEREEKDIRSRG